MARPWLISCSRERLAGRRRRSRAVISLEGLERRELLTVDVSVTGTVDSRSQGLGTLDVWQSESIVYTLTVKNNVGGTGEGVVVSDVLDPRLVFSQVWAPGFAETVDYTRSYDAATHVATLTFPSLHGVAEVRFEAVAFPSASGVPGPQLTNDFSITTTDPNTNPQTSGSLPFDDAGPIADVALTSVTAVTPDGHPPHVGGELDYAFVVTNNSTTATVPNARVVLSWLVGTNGENPGWVAYPGGGSIIAPPFPDSSVYVIGDLAPGQSRTVPLVLHPLDFTSPPSPITFQVYATADAFDLVPANNVQNVSTPLAPGAAVQVAVIPNAGVVPAGGDLTYTVTLNNGGPDHATGVVMSQALPAGTTFVSARWNGQPIAGTVDAGVLSIALPLDRSGTLGVTLNTAGVATAGPVTLSGPIDVTWNEEPKSSHGVYALGTVLPAGSLAIGLNASQTAVYVNNSLTYSYTVTNERTTDAHDVVVSFAFPPASQVTLTPGAYTVEQTPTGQVAVFHLADLPAGASRTLSVEAVALLPSVGVLSVIGTVVEADRPASDYPALTLDTSVLPWADLSVQPLPSSYSYGRFKFVVTNNGPSAATGVRLSFDRTVLIDFALRDGVYVPVAGVAVYPPYGHQPPTITPPYYIVIGDLAVGQSTVIEVSSGNEAALATVTANEADFVSGNNSTRSVHLPDGRLLSVASQLTTDVTSVATGGYATFTAVTTNVGASYIHDMTLAAAIPANSRLVSASPGVVVQGNLLLFTIDYLPIGATAGFQYVVSPTWDALPGGLASNMGIYQSAQSVSNPAASVASATVAVVAGPSGSPVLGATSYAVDANAGSVAITINRVGGVSGPLTIDYATVAGDALAGRDFTPTWGTLTFADGETSKTIAVPIVADLYGTGDRSFLFYIGTGASAVVTIHEAVPPTVASVQWRGAAIDVRFARPVAASTARASANFALVTPGRDQKFGTRDDRRIGLTVWYDPTTLTSRLTPWQRLPANGIYRLTVSGAGVRGATGVLLAGDGVHPGTDFTAELVRRRPPIARRVSPAAGR
ncbi:MAG: Calx-beta domain-containing protein [Paludisphaera borealis]|uniref:Calx-beta domain-containing protein n=1 Tax=Paludisphaera borealis TaxID=1387353 RepID=UPI002849ED36|nr:Calx-beta domain-containing protein [Paludisphaera borealis]MDR3619691.1 Calx-beta domain-containing protein [Paludisphaera borealis]